MIAASLKDAEGDKIIDILLRKGADVSMKSNSGQVSGDFKTLVGCLADTNRMLCILQAPKSTFLRSEAC